MALSLAEVRRISQDVVASDDSTLRVVGVSKVGRAYAEVMVFDVACSSEPCRMLIGADRTQSEPAFRRAISDELRRQIEQRNRTRRRSQHVR